MKAKRVHEHEKASLPVKGEMAERIRAFDWSRTSLGPSEKWPLCLRTVADVMLTMHVPVVLRWGSDLIMIYNDAYRVILADRHPAALGRASREVWPEVWPTLQPIFDTVMERGEAGSIGDEKFLLNRHGYLEDVYFTLSYFPVRDEAGRVGGILGVFNETIAQKQAEDALRESEERLRLALAAVHMGVFDWDILTDRITWSREHEELWGFKPGEFSGTYASFLSRFHPDDISCSTTIINTFGRQLELPILCGGFGQ